MLSSQRQTEGMFGLVVAMIALWLASSMANVLVWTFDEPILHMLITTVLVTVPFGILCGPVVGAVNPDNLLPVFGSLALLLTAAGFAGMALPVGSYRLAPWWTGAATMTLAIHLVYTADTGMPVLAGLCALMLAVCTAADTNRAVSDLHAKPYHASQLGALL